MALETGTYTSDLVETNPVPADGLSQTDDHLRLIKSVLKNTFPNIAGAITPTHTVINSLPGSLNAAVARLNDVINDTGMPVGTIVMWYGTAAAIPSKWHLCDGTNGTPNLLDRMPKGCTSDGGRGALAGASSMLSSAAGAHGHGESASGGHYHHFEVWSGQPSGSLVVESGGPSAVSNTVHQHLVYGDTWAVGDHVHAIWTVGDHQHSVTIDPPSAAVYFIMKITP